MDLKLLPLLACPKCQSSLACQATKTDVKEKVLEGTLTCASCQLSYPILRGIPRFVSMENYASSFGYQWNLYKYTQVDSFSNFSGSADRFFAETRWTLDSINHDWIAEIGCGNGRFLEIASRSTAQVVGVDISSAIDAAGELFQERENVHLVQASIYNLPFKKGVFDKLYSIGVIQHTPDPALAIKSLPTFVKKDGQMALTIYEKKPWTLFYAKYLIRPITKRMNKKVLLTTIKLMSPILFPITEVLFRIPKAGKLFQFLIPYANYVNFKDLSLKQRYEWAVLDTFDMLSPAYDSPMTEAAVRASLQESAVTQIERLSNPGVNVVAVI